MAYYPQDRVPYVHRALFWEYDFQHAGGEDSWNSRQNSVDWQEIVWIESPADWGRAMLSG